MVAVRWYLRYSLSYRDVEELPAERGIEVDHVPIYRWVYGHPVADQRRTALPARSGGSLVVDETRLPDRPIDLLRRSRPPGPRPGKGVTSS
jgi:transposase-like protein